MNQSAPVYQGGGGVGRLSQCFMFKFEKQMITLV